MVFLDSSYALIIILTKHLFWIIFEVVAISKLSVCSMSVYFVRRNIYALCNFLYEHGKFKSQELVH